ncbi:PIG-L deacetylase family protein [Amycolatopsis benzoatilytica]|uniref:PIG-L deacetylase family protein n=1 Tax=Amycolatopsis benzoatilytica TaxID=346045 RepID=UPI00037AA863|nr:PIG-L family deacetylase [Amycolatopsis benzoatilytica]
MRALFPEVCAEITVLGAHCDDIAIGAGGSLLELCRANPGMRVTALVLSGAGTPREAEERAALAAFCPKADLAVTVLDLRDGRLPAQWDLAKDALEALRRQCEPDLVFAPAAHDAHQDHRGLAKLVPTAFRDHVILGYEILKWESDLAQPTVFFPLAEETIREKSDLLATHYRSQHGRGWFDHEAFAGLARVRGVQCQHRYAEAFNAPKLTIAAARSSAAKRK